MPRGFVAREQELDPGLSPGLDEVEHFAARQPEHPRHPGVSECPDQDVNCSWH
jgi:hypothetical protein